MQSVSHDSLPSFVPPTGKPALVVVDEETAVDLEYAPALPPPPTFRHAAPPQWVPELLGEEFVPPYAPPPPATSGPTQEWKGRTSESLGSERLDAASHVSSAWDERRRDVYGEVGSKAWLEKRRAHISERVELLNNIIHAPAPPPEPEPEPEPPEPEPEPEENLDPTSPKFAYQEACRARGAAQSAAELRTSVMAGSHVEAQVQLLTSHLNQVSNFAPVKFRQLEDEVLALQHALVAEIKARKQVGLELSQQRDSILEESQRMIRESSELWGDTCEELSVTINSRADQAVERILRQSLENDMRTFERDMDARMNEASSQIMGELADESDDRMRGLHNFEAKLKSQYDNIQDQILQNRADRAQTEDMIVGFLDKLCNHEKVTSAQPVINAQ